MAVWLPGYQIIQLGATGGNYDRTDHPKLCWHTTEGGSLAGAESAFYKYPPHLGVDPDSGECHQYVPVDRRAYSLGNSDAEDSYVIQVEVVGYAAESHDWPPERLQWLAAHVVAPVADAVGVPPVAAPQGFHGQGEGIVLASSSSPIRFDLAGWDGFAGHVGHQHCPGDDHWDPGRLDLDTILAGTTPKPEPEARDMAAPFTLTDSRARQWVFYKGADGACWARCDGDRPFSLGGLVTDAISATAGPVGIIDVYAYTPDGSMWAIHSDGSGWGDWYQVAA